MEEKEDGFVNNGGRRGCCVVVVVDVDDDDDDDAFCPRLLQIVQWSSTQPFTPLETHVVVVGWRFWNHLTCLTVPVVRH